MPKEVLQIVPPSFISLMCGVTHATYNGSTVTLHYTDGTTESARIQMTDKHRENFFALVGDVQEKARRKVTA